MIELVIPEDRRLHFCSLNDEADETVRYFKAKSTIWFLTADVYKALGWSTKDFDDFSVPIYTLAVELLDWKNDPDGSETYPGNLPLRTPVICMDILLNRLALFAIEQT